MSDILALAVWIGEHPRTGADVAHVLLYPATDLDPEGPAKVTALALLVGAVDANRATEMPTLDAEVDVRGIFRYGGEIKPLPNDPADEWSAAALAQGFVVVTITSQRPNPPTIAGIDSLIDSGAPMWTGLSKVQHP